MENMPLVEEPEYIINELNCYLKKFNQPKIQTILLNSGQRYDS
ncbi:Uncharacterised protein [Salmonella bongori]|nr:Uncharacterised protein [Salmonella bongori]